MTHGIFLQVLTLRTVLMEDPRLFINIIHRLFLLLNSKQTKIVLIPEAFGYYQFFWIEPHRTA